MPSCTILQINRPIQPDPPLRQFGIDLPAIGTFPADFIRIAGWVLAHTPIAALHLLCDGSVLRTIPLNRPRPDVIAQFPGGAEQCGFHTQVLALELPPQFELTLAARFPSGELIPLARILGAHSRTPDPSAATRLQPLLVTSLGRTGTTLLLRSLADHPAIVAQRAYPYESHAAAQWMHLARAMALPEDTLSSFPHAPGACVPSPDLPEFLDQTYPSLAANFSCSAIDAFYRHVAQRQNQPAPRFFCEKFLPTGIQNLFLNLYPGAREIFLVRDFRDVLCSIFAFNAKRGTVEFGRERVNSDEEFVADLAREAHRLLLNFHGRAARDTGIHPAPPADPHAGPHVSPHVGPHLVHYEELILRPQKTLRAIFDYLSLPAPPDLPQLIRTAGEGPAMAHHRTTASPLASIGRWKTDLTPAMCRLARAAFDDMLHQWGYEFAPDGTLILPDPEPA